LEQRLEFVHHALEQADKEWKQPEVAGESELVFAFMIASLLTVWLHFRGIADW
jgi:hypothetical protein